MRTLRLGDGRELAYEEQGDPGGVPLLLFHGLPGSRLTRHPEGSIAATLGLRVLTFDRPGIGGSTARPGRTLLDWPADVAEAADALGLGRFAVLGWSGGGPYALACAFALPERVSRVGLVAPVMPLVQRGALAQLSPDLRRRARVARLAPWLVRLTVARDARRIRRDPAGALERDFASSPRADRAVLDDPALRRMLLESRAAAFAQGPGGVFEEAMLYLRPWGFPLERVGADVLLWQGEEDETIRPPSARRLAAALPRCRATYVPGEAHMLCLTRWREVLAELSASP